MPQGPDFRQYLDQALQIGTLTRAQAQKMTKDLVREGHLAQGRAQSYVDELVERSRKRTEGVVALVRQEVKSQIAALGIATKEDIARLEARLNQSPARTTTASNPGPELPLGGAAVTKPPVKQPAKKPAKKAASKKTSSKGGE